MFKTLLKRPHELVSSLGFDTGTIGYPIDPVSFPFEAESFEFSVPFQNSRLPVSFDSPTGRDLFSCAFPRPQLESTKESMLTESSESRTIGLRLEELSQMELVLVGLQHPDSFVSVCFPLPDEHVVSGVLEQSDSFLFVSGSTLSDVDLTTSVSLHHPSGPLVTNIFLSLLVFCFSVLLGRHPPDITYMHLMLVSCRPISWHWNKFLSCLCLQL